MKKLIKITSLIVVLSLVMTFFGEVNTIDVSAASSKKVTATEKKKIKKLCKNFTDFLAHELTDDNLTSNIKKGKSITWEFQKWSKEDDIYKPNLVVPLWYMTIKNPAKKVFDIDDFSVETLEGDWGTISPYLSLKSVTKLSSKKYKAVFNIKWVNSENNKRKTTGIATFTLKKKAGTYYGFVAKSVKIKKTANKLP